jgi:proline racemase
MAVWKELSKANEWSVPAGWHRLTTLDMHTEGEPLRVILGGFPMVEGQTILDYRRYLKDNWDHLRTALMWEPRGHADMYGCLITPAVRADSDFGVLFLHNEGYSSMCGHAIIALAKLVVEMGWVQREEPQTMVKIDAPAGQIVAWARVKAHTVQSVFFHNVPSFVSSLGETVEVPRLGRVVYDLAYGGAFYAYVNADQLGISMEKENVNELIQKGMAIKRAVMAESKAIVHPFEEDLSFLYGTIFYGEAPEGSEADSRNVCIFAEGEVDRSPTGTGGERPYGFALRQGGTGRRGIDADREHHRICLFCQNI